MMHRDRQTVEAMHRLAASPDYQLYLGWVQASLAEIMLGLVSCESDQALRQQQGAARALQELLARAADTGDVLAKLAAQGRENRNDRRP